MPADDLVLNVRQIAQYTPATSVPQGATVLMQTGGIGGPYASISPANLVGTALAQGGAMMIAGPLSAQSVQVGSGQFSNLAAGVIEAQTACIFQADLTVGSIGGVPIATQGWVSAALAGVSDNTVWRFNSRTGDVHLTLNDILWAGGAPIVSPVFGGCPTAPTPPPRDSSDQIATTAWVMNNALVSSFNGRIGQIELLPMDIIAAGGATLDTPIFTGNPQAPTPPPGDSSSSIATTEFVMNAIQSGAFAPLDSPAFTGVPTGPTASPGASTGQLATTAFVQAAVAAATAGVASFNGRTGHVVLSAVDVSTAGGALLASPAFTGVPVAPTAVAGTNTPQLATTAFVMSAVSGGGSAGVASFNTRTGAVTLAAADVSGVGGALLASPALTGSPTAPTQPTSDNSTLLATTAFVKAAVAAGTAGVATFNGRTGAVTLVASDVSAAGGALTTSPVFTGVPSAPTASPGDTSTQIATTAYVQAAITSGTAGVATFNGRTGAVTLTQADITGAGGALLSSPAFTGNPSAPTASVGTSTGQLATTAFVQAAVAASTTGVTSFNSRTGAVALSGADVSAAGGALLAGPTFTGVPSGPTALAGTSTTQLATTAFVAAAILAGGGVASFNSRTGNVTLSSADITGAGGAILASPAFTGSPTAPTAPPGTSTTQIASTAFVGAALPGPATVAPLADGTAAVGTSLLYARQDHVHPASGGGAGKWTQVGTSGTITGTPTTISITGIPLTYGDLMIVANNISPGTTQPLYMLVSTNNGTSYSGIDFSLPFGGSFNNMSFVMIFHGYSSGFGLVLASAYEASGAFPASPACTGNVSALGSGITVHTGGCNAIRFSLGGSTLFGNGGSIIVYAR